MTKRTLSPQSNLPPEPEPNPAPFPYRDYVAALKDLAAALRRGVFYGLVVGPSGMGKTCLSRDFTSELDRHQFQLLYLSTPRVSLLSIVRYFAQVLRVLPRRSSLETIQVISEVLRARPTRLVVWIDEATGLSSATLAELRSMAEFSNEVPQIFSVVLAGPTELRSTLEAPSLFHLKRRISVRCALDGLLRNELEPFLAHRFGTEARRLPVGLHDELFERTHATPALLDRVGQQALGRTRGPVTEEQLREAFDACAL